MNENAKLVKQQEMLKAAIEALDMFGDRYFNLITIFQDLDDSPEASRKACTVLQTKLDSVSTQLKRQLKLAA